MHPVFISNASAQSFSILSGAERDSAEAKRLYRQGLPEGYIISMSGSVVDGHQIWKPKLWTEIEDKIALSGPLLQGQPFESIVSDSTTQAIQRLKKLLAAYIYADTKDLHLPAPGRESVFFLDNGDIFFAPRNLANLQATTQEDHSLFCQKSLLGLLSRILSGSMNQETDSCQGIPPHIYQPELAQETSKQIHQSLTQGQSLTEEQLQRIMLVVETLAIEKKLQLPPKNTPILQNARRYAHLKKRFTRIVHEKRSKLYTSAFLLLMIAFLYISGIGTPAADQDFSHLTPEEIVSLYYASFNSLDHQTMDRISSGRVARNEIRSILQIDLADKTNLGHTAQRSIISPQEFLDGTIPKRFQNIFGISDLSIEEIARSDSSAEYYVEAVQWAPAQINPEQVQSTEEYEQIMMQSPHIRRIRRGDFLRLQLTRRGWQISALDFNLIEELPMIPREELLDN